MVVSSEAILPASALPELCICLLQVELVLHKLQTTRKKHQKHCQYWYFQTASTIFMVLYLWGSSCGDDDVSPTHWLSLDRDHLHSAIPMFGKMLGFSKQIHSPSFRPASVLHLDRWKKRVKGITAEILTNPQLSQWATKGEIWKVDLLGEKNKNKNTTYTWSSSHNQL